MKSVPSDKTDAVSVIEHELGHALGIKGFYPLSATSKSDLGSFKSTYDKFIQFQNSVPLFTGPNAEAANNGNPIPLTHYPLSDTRSSQNIFHLGMNPIAGPFGSDLMTGADFQNGFRYTISATDVAIVQDITGLTAAMEPPPPQMKMTFIYDFPHKKDHNQKDHHMKQHSINLSDFDAKSTMQSSGGGAALDPQVPPWTGRWETPP